MADLLLKTEKLASTTEALSKLQKCMDDTHAELKEDCQENNQLRQKAEHELDAITRLVRGCK